MTLSWLRGSLRWKLVLAAVLIEAVMLLLLFANNARLFNKSIEQQGVQKVQELSSMLNVALAPALFQRDYARAQGIIDDLLRDNSAALAYLVILDESGRVFGRGGRVNTDSLPRVAAVPNSHEVLFNGALPLHVGAQQVGELRYGLSFATLFEARAGLLRQGLLIALLGMLLTILALSAAGYWLTRHMNKLMQASQAIAAGRYDVKAEVVATDEIGQLARNFNEMGAAICAHTGEMQRTRIQLQATIAAIPDLLFEVGLDGTYHDIHAQSPHLLSASSEKLLGKKVGDVMPAAATEIILLALQEAYASGRSYGRQFELQLAQGSTWFELSVSGKLGLPGQEPRFIVLSRDITERYLAQANLEQRVQQRTAELLIAKNEAERASNAKSEFLSRMSHELRTPMNGILGFAQLLSYNQTTPLDGEQQNYVREILHAGDHLLELINEVLDLARIESGRLDLAPENIAVAQLVRETMPLVQTLAAKNNLTLSANLAGDYVIRADPMRLRQILLNLLSNAIKYNRKGGSVAISCRSQREGWLKIEVRDSGRGIVADELARLFIPFERLDSAYSGVEGAGIGLALSRKLTEAMDGVIGVESEVGAGSTFWIEFPLLVEENSEPLPDLNAIQTGRLNERKVLYIEDNPSSLRLVEKSISGRFGMAMLNAHNAELGLEMARAYLPDIILLDINLPGMDGFKALEILQNDVMTCDIPVIAITANAMERDIKKGLDAGFADYLTKPLDIIQLVVLLGKLSGKKERAVPGG
ncbi:MAG: ATP-binding protein [Gallionellaceae bacterium]|jgi:signal transduction histidine kinase/CheY-like chemotaxis protein/HAMP domain-containing protein